MSDKTKLVVRDNDGEHLWVTWGDTELIVSVATGQLQGFLGAGFGDELTVMHANEAAGMVNFIVIKPSAPRQSSEVDALLCENCGAVAHLRCSSCGEPACAVCMRYSREGAQYCPSCMAVNA